MLLAVSLLFSCHWLTVLNGSLEGREYAGKGRGGKEKKEKQRGKATEREESPKYVKPRKVQCVFVLNWRGTLTFCTMPDITELVPGSTQEVKCRQYEGVFLHSIGSSPYNYEKSM